MAHRYRIAPPATLGTVPFTYIAHRRAHLAFAMVALPMATRPHLLHGYKFVVPSIKQYVPR